MGSRVLISAVLMLVVSFACAGPAGADEGKIIDYPSGAAYLPQTPSVTGGAAGAFANPAAWSTNDRAELAFWWNDASVRGGTLDNWGISTGRHLGFAVQRSVLGTRAENSSLYDYQVGLAGGNRALHAGLAYRWATGATEAVGRENAWVAGLIGRPGKWASVGLSGAFATGSDARLGVVDVGLRPFSAPWLTLFADYALRESNRLDEGHWGAGVEIRPIRGIHLGVKVRDAEGSDDFGYSLNLGLTLDGSGFHVLPSYNQDGDRREESGALRPTTYLVRLNPPFRGLPLQDFARRATRSNRYLELDLHDKHLDYQKARYFDHRRIAWIDLAHELDRIRDDRSVRGVAINLSGFSARMSLAWEFREKLRELQRAEKEIIIQIEESRFGGFYLASVADHLVIDPEGEILIPGMVAHRTYMKGLLDKLGIGFDEWRFMKYKSAYEGFSREDMSEADREQIGRALDVVYARIRDDVSESRGWGPGHFDGVVENHLLLTAEQAVESDAVDRIGRWHELADWLKEERNGATLEKPCYADLGRAYHDERWGRPPEISVVYALGPCAMHEGIRGRATSEHLRKMAKKDGVAGVVLRADSPGGSPLPSDLVAEGMKLVQEADRPVVVSQGNVAGSGGYWISMPGTRILTTPLTVTGSIGVIGGWAWDTGLGEKTGFSADGVKRGTHSDLFGGIRFPLLGRLATRNLDASERAMVRELILGLYDDFVAEVAELRHLEVEHVREIAQGRIWMGPDAIDLGLCDEIGTLPDAIAETKRLAGIDAEEEVILTEFPPRVPFQFPSFGPQIPGLSALVRIFGGWPMTEDAVSAEEASDYSTFYVREIARSKGDPLLLVPEALPDGWYEAP